MKTEAHSGRGWACYLDADGKVVLVLTVGRKRVTVFASSRANVEALAVALFELTKVDPLSLVGRPRLVVQGKG